MRCRGSSRKIVTVFEVSETSDTKIIMVFMAE